MRPASFRCNLKIALCVMRTLCDHFDFRIGPSQKTKKRHGKMEQTTAVAAAPTRRLQRESRSAQFRTAPLASNRFNLRRCPTFKSVSECLRKSADFSTPKKYLERNRQHAAYSTSATTWDPNAQWGGAPTTGTYTMRNSGYQ